MSSNGTLFTWGDNVDEQLTPQQIDPYHFHGKIIQSIHIGGVHTLALCTDGSLFAWGDNEHGQLALDHTNEQLAPQLISNDHFQGKNIQSIYTVGDHILVQCTDGSLFAWGRNECGQLALGHTNDQYTPQLTSNDHFQEKHIQSFHTGDNHTIVLCTDGSLFAWGKNNDGQLGLGHNNNEHTPQPLQDPLERAFRKGHQTLNSNAFFSNTSVDPTSRFLSKFVLSSGDTATVRTMQN